MTSTIIRSARSITSAAVRKIERDPAIIADGCVWAFDFTDPACNPSTAVSPADGIEFTNLARAESGISYGPSGVLRNAGQTISQVSGRGGFVFPSGTFSTGNYIEIGGAAVDFGPNNDDFLAIVWDLQPLTGYNTSNFAPILWDATSNANTASLWIDSGAGGVRPRGAVGTGSTNVGIEAASAGIGQGSLRQLAFAREGQKLSFFVNGVLSATRSDGPATIHNETTNPAKLAANHVGTIYRTLAYRMPQNPLKSPAELVAADYAAKPFLFR